MSLSTSTIQLKRVLVATDFSVSSRTALRYAAAIARNHGARLYVLHVVSSVGYKLVGPDSEVQAAELAARDLKEFWVELTGNDQSSGIELALIVRRGDVCAEVQDVIEKEQIDIAVVGTSGRTGLAKVVMGSVAEQVFRRISCPVLTVGPNSARDWPEKQVGAEKTILFATDFRHDSIAALPHAVSIANRSGSRLVLLHVIRFIANEGEGGYFSGALPAAEQEIREASLHRLSGLVPRDMKLKPESMVTFALPVDGILSTATSTGAGLIVLGVHQKSLLVPAGHLPATTSYAVAIGAQCPVLTVRT